MQSYFQPSYLLEFCLAKVHIGCQNKTMWKVRKSCW